MKISEDKVTRSVRKYLEKRKYTIKGDTRKRSHGPDLMTTYHKIYRRQYIIEAKGEAGIKESVGVSIKHNSFYMMLGQILARMDKEGNHPKRGRIYALAIPRKWERTFKHKIKTMRYAWKLLRLRVFLVDNKGGVSDKPYSYFLK